MEGFAQRYTIEKSYESSEHTVVMKVKRNSPRQRRRVAKLVLTDKMGEESKRRVKREPKFMKKFEGNMFFVQMYRSVNCEGVLYIIMEQCETDLLSYIDQNPHLRLNISWVRRTLKRLALIVKDMHDAGIVHRDIKLENFFVRGDGSICIGDFGLASRDVEKNCTSGVGTVTYAAPELFSKLKKIDMKKTDIYSLGITFYTIAMHELPLCTLPLERIRYRKLIGALGMQSTSDMDLDNLILRMTWLTPDYRLTISEVLDHDFFEE